jgi:NADPH:quinone reductase-like Zn-dependent oxidoreductase
MERIMARVVRFHRIGGPEVLQIENLDVPAPQAGEVRINVKALGLNRAEAMFRAGQCLEKSVFPSKRGYEAARTVDAVGPGVEGLTPGDAVSTVPALPLGKYGVYGDAAVVPASAVAKHRASLSWTEAAAIWMQYLTAYGALIDIAELTAGDTVLILAASSSVGIAAMQIARRVGATPIALTRKSDKREALLKLGAASAIATEEQDVAAEVRKLTGGRGRASCLTPLAGRLLPN